MAIFSPEYHAGADTSIVRLRDRRDNPGQSSKGWRGSPRRCSHFRPMAEPSAFLRDAAFSPLLRMKSEAKSFTAFTLGAARTAASRRVAACEPVNSRLCARQDLRPAKRPRGARTTTVAPILTRL